MCISDGPRAIEVRLQLQQVLCLRPGASKAVEGLIELIAELEADDVVPAGRAVRHRPGDQRLVVHRVASPTGTVALHWGVSGFVFGGRPNMPFSPKTRERSLRAVKPSSAFH